MALAGDGDDVFEFCERHNSIRLLIVNHDATVDSLNQCHPSMRMALGLDDDQRNTADQETRAAPKRGVRRLRKKHRAQRRAEQQQGKATRLYSRRIARPVCEK